MAPTLGSLPNEIKQAIIRELVPHRLYDEVESLLNLRLVCKDLCNNASREFQTLFSEVTILYHFQGLRRLVEITNHPELRNAIKSITISTFRLTRRGLHYISKEHQAIRINYLDEQDFFDSSGIGTSLLTQIFRRCTNCRTVTITSTVGGMACRRMNASIPVGMILDYRMLNSEEGAAHRHIHDIMSAATRAMTFSRLDIIDFSVGSVREGDYGYITAEAFTSKQMDMELILPAFKKLCSLHLALANIYKQNNAATASFIGQIQTLQRLTLIFEVNTGYSPQLGEILRTVTLSKLRSFGLEDACTNGILVSKFIQRHRSTIEKIDLYGTDIENYADWKDILVSSLDVVNLKSMRIDKPYLELSSPFDIWSGPELMEGDVQAHLEKAIATFYLEDGI